MDIRKFSVALTGVLALKNAAGMPMLGEDGAPMSITLFSPGSSEYAQAEVEQQNRLVDTLKEKGKSNRKVDDTAREKAEFLAACTEAFSPNIEYDGKTGAALFKAVYADRQLGFIAEQVSRFLGDWANFTPGSPTP